MTKCIIGIDCATNPGKVGLARAYLSDTELYIDQLSKRGSDQTVSGVVAEWINLEIPTLLTIDAPLGWPESLV